MVDNIDAFKGIEFDDEACAEFLEDIESVYSTADDWPVSAIEGWVLKPNFLPLPHLMTGHS